MSRVVFLLEEPSMKVLLEGLLPRLLPSLPFLCITHEGKQDLERSIPRKLKAWREPGVRFVVVRDNDRGDCHALKARLVDLCREAGHPETLIRIACQELEAWYLGEPEALAQAYGERQRLSGLANKAKYRNPDALDRPSEELAKLVPAYQKISGARRLSALLTEERNRSNSFHVFLAGARRIATAIARNEEVG
ncbi:MAG: DUF4276 family protein [Thermoanaerobaculia bacterium]|nr:DUF4276 family protein [Thermoanaerobaculia bacterium]